MANMTTIEILTGIKNWVLGKIGNITALIPSQASSSNQLADKAFVNSSIATATATYRGNYNVVTDLSLSYNATHAQIQTALATKMSALSITPDNNDYAFVQIPTADATPTEIAKTEKYKYNGTDWAFEYELNSSGFTAAQWAAINSGATLELIGKLSALPTNAELTTLLNGKEAVANKVTNITSDSTDTQYGSAKSVYTLVMSVATAIREWANNIFAKIDGYYETMVVGAAKNLEGRGSVGAEYRFRPTAGSGSVGSGAAKITKMLGNTLVWNQLVRNGNFASSSGWDVFRYTSVFSNNSVTLTKEQVSGSNYSHFMRNIPNIPVGHKVFMWIEYASSRSGVRFEISYSEGVDYSRIDLPNTSLQKTVKKGIVTTSTREKRVVDIVDYENSALTLIIYNIKIIDLTLMFGAGNEPTAAQFETMYPLSYYAYNAGTLINNEATGIKTVGFNLYNPTTGKAYVTGATGTADLTNGKNCYQITGAYTSITDAAGNAITPNEGGFFEVAKAQELTVAGGDSTTCLHLTHSGYRNGEYEAYWESLLNLNLKTLTGKLNGEGESVVVFPDGLKSAGTIYDEIYRDSNGVLHAIKRLEKVEMSSLDFSYNSQLFVAQPSGIYVGRYRYNGIRCSKYTYSTVDNATYEGMDDKSFLVKDGFVHIKDSSYTDVATFIAALSGEYLYYRLATPEDYILEESPNWIYREDGYGTEERLPADTDSAVTAPIKYEVEYPMDAVGMLTDLPDTYVSGKESQEFTSTEKEQARQNIGAASLADVQALFAALPTTDPGTAGALWNDNGTVKISTGE